MSWMVLQHCDNICWEHVQLIGQNPRTFPTSIMASSHPLLLWVLTMFLLLSVTTHRHMYLWLFEYGILTPQGAGVYAELCGVMSHRNGHDRHSCHLIPMPVDVPLVWLFLGIFGGFFIFHHALLRCFLGVELCYRCMDIICRWMGIMGGCMLWMDGFLWMDGCCRWMDIVDEWIL